MAAYVVVNVDVRDPERYAEYVERTPESIARFGGRFVARGGRTDVLEGDWEPKRFVIIEFPTYADATAWWASEEYAEAKALRQATASTQMVVTEGV